MNQAATTVHCTRKSTEKSLSGVNLLCSLSITGFKNKHIFYFLLGTVCKSNYRTLPLRWSIQHTAWIGFIFPSYYPPSTRQKSKKNHLPSPIPNFSTACCYYTGERISWFSISQTEYRTDKFVKSDLETEAFWQSLFAQVGMKKKF